MSISNPFTRPSPFRPSSFSNNKIQQSHVSPFTPQSENYSKWQPKYSQGNDYSKPSYNNYGGSTSTFPDSYSYQNKNIGGGFTSYGNSNEKYSLGAQYNAAYTKKQQQRPSHDYSPRFQNEYTKESSKDLFNDKNPFNRPSLFQRPSISISTPYKQKSYDLSPKNYDNYRYYGDNRTNDYSQQYSSNKMGYMGKDYDTKSDAASVATYINKIIDIDDRKSDYTSGLNSSRLGTNYKNKNPYHEGSSGYNDYGGLQDNPTQMFKDYEHLKYRPSLKDDKNEKQGSGAYGGDKYKMYAISQKQLKKSDDYLDDGTGKFGRSKTYNNEEEYDYRDNKHRKNAEESDYERDYNYKKDYLEDQIYTKIKDNYDFEEKDNKFTDYDFRKKIPQLLNNQETFKYNEEGKYNKQLYQPINHQYDNYTKKTPNSYEQYEPKNNRVDHEIEEKRKQLQFEDYNEDEDDEPPSHFGTKKGEKFQSKRIEESESDKDAYYDFEKEDSFEQNVRNKKKTHKIWDRNGPHRYEQNNPQENYVQPSFGKTNQRPDQYSSPQFYGYRKNNEKEQIVQEPSLQDIFNNNEIVRFQDESENESEAWSRKQRKNVPSNDVDTPQKYPKVVEIHGTIFHRVELQLN